MKAWLFQDHRQKEKLGDACPWSVGWIDPDGKRKSKRLGSESAAKKYQRKIEGQLAAGTYENRSRAGWADFEKEFKANVMAGMKPGTRDATQYALNHWNKIAKPVRMASITSRTIADYVAKRRTEKRSKKGPIVSPATINKELRTIRAVLRKAHRWGYLPRLPEFDFLKEPGRLPTYVTPEHFGAIYGACKVATAPGRIPFPAADWWRGLLTMAYMTGWRIGSLLSLRWQDVDLKAGTAMSLAEHNKGGRDMVTPLHPLAVDHLERLTAGRFGALVFPWNEDRRRLWDEFATIQDAAGVKPATGPKPHYGFHDFCARAFATMNADKLSADTLQVGPNAAPGLSDDATLHQHGPATHPGDPQPVCPHTAGPDRDGHRRLILNGR